jgi:hypothetical protein
LHGDPYSHRTGDAGGAPLKVHEDYLA